MWRVFKLQMNDCGACMYCLDKKKYGGPGRKKKCCERRQCTKINMSESAYVSHKEPHIGTRLCVA